LLTPSMRRSGAVSASRTPWVALPLTCLP
jgi:hypothetical protein